MKKKMLIIVPICIMTFIALAIFFEPLYSPYNHLKGKSLSGDDSAFSLINEAKNELIKINKNNKNLSVGEIIMELGHDGKGVVKLTFVTKKKGLVWIDVDTKEMKIINIEKMGYESKLYPGTLDIDRWTIDSKQVIETARNLMNNDGMYVYNEIILRSFSTFYREHESWSILFRDTLNDKSYSVSFDPFSGEVLTSNS